MDNSLASQLPPLPPEFTGVPTQDSYEEDSDTTELPTSVTKEPTAAVTPPPTQLPPIVPPTTSSVVPPSHGNSKDGGRTNTVMTVITTVFSILVIVIIVISVLLVRSLEQSIESLQIELAGTNTNKDDLQRRVDSLTVDNADLQNKVLQLRSGNTNQTDTTCNQPTASIGVAEYRVPCRWHAYFEIRYTAQPDSIGYINDSPITTVLSAPVSSTIRATVHVTRYSPQLSNAQTDPLSGIIKTYQSSGKFVHQFNNTAGSTMYEVKPFTTNGVDKVRFYSQKISGNDTYVFYVEYALSDAESLRLVMDNFTWKI